MLAKTLRRLVFVIATLAVAGTAAIGAVRQSSMPSPVAAFATGEHVNGVPVYRLPAVNVTVSRKAELARMAQEDAVAMKK